MEEVGVRGCAKHAAILVMPFLPGPYLHVLGEKMQSPLDWHASRLIAFYEQKLENSGRSNNLIFLLNEAAFPVASKEG